MAIKLHRTPPTFNATERRVKILSRYICDHLKAEQAKCQAKGLHYSIKAIHIEDALDRFTAPGSHVLTTNKVVSPESLFKKGR